MLVQYLIHFSLNANVRITYKSPHSFWNFKSLRLSRVVLIRILLSNQGGLAAIFTFQLLKVVMEIDSGDTKLKMDNYQVIEQIGRGAFRAVFLVLHKIEKKK